MLDHGRRAPPLRRPLACRLSSAAALQPRRRANVVGMHRANDIDSHLRARLPMLSRIVLFSGAAVLVAVAARWPAAAAAAAGGNEERDRGGLLPARLRGRADRRRHAQRPEPDAGRSRAARPRADAVRRARRPRRLARALPRRRLHARPRDGGEATRSGRSLDVLAELRQKDGFDRGPRAIPTCGSIRFATPRWCG